MLFSIVRTVIASDLKGHPEVMAGIEKADAGITALIAVMGKLAPSDVEEYLTVFSDTTGIKLSEAEIQTIAADVCKIPVGLKQIQSVVEIMK